jgi:Flp pilus assembly protein TadD
MRALVAGLFLLPAISLGGCSPHGVRGNEVASDRTSLATAQEALTDGEAGTSLAIAKGILASQPNNASALAQAGDAQAAMGDRLSAEGSYRRALALAPHDVKARMGMAKLMLRDDLKGAETSFRDILNDQPHNPAVLNDLGYVLDLQERHTEAQAMYVEALTSDPNRLSVRVNLALSLALSGQAARAEQMLRDLAQNVGATSKVRLDLAVAEVMAGHDMEAMQVMGTELSPEEAKAALEGIQQLKPAAASIPVASR